MKQIKIDSLSQDKVQFGTKITIESDGKKYSFFDTKKDKSFTKAYDQFKRFKFGIGDVVSAEVSEEEKSFVNEAGKNVKYTQRTILYFQESDNIPEVEVAPKAEKQFGLNEAWSVIRQLQAGQEGIYKRLSALETPKEATEDKGDGDLPPF